MGQVLSSNAGELRRVYSDDIVDRAVDLYAKGLSFIEGTKREDGDIGEAMYWQFKLHSGWGVGPTSEEGVFSDSGTNLSVNPYFVLGELQGSVKYSLLYKEQARGRGVYGGAQDGIKEQTKERMQELLSLADRYICGGSGDGALATVQDTTDTATTFVAGLPFGLTLLDKNMPIQIHDGTSTEREDFVRISKIVHSTRTVTLPAAITLTAGDKIYMSRGASGGTFGISNIMNGFGNLISDSGTVHNINRSTYEEWKAQVFSNGGNLRNYSDEYLHEALAVTSARTKADTVVDTLVSNEGLLKKYNDSKQSNIRFNVTNGDGSSLNSGVNLKPSFAYGDRSIPWVSFRHIKPRTIYGLSKSNFKRVGWARPKWLGAGDPELALSSSARITAEEVFLYWPVQVIGRRFNNMFAISDLSDPVHCGAVVGGSDT
jgi:hypothetical protein